jgi:hypothetical protein
MGIEELVGEFKEVRNMLLPPRLKLRARKKSGKLHPARLRRGSPSPAWSRHNAEYRPPRPSSSV